jgi:hypothetical protein
MVGQMESASQKLAETRSSDHQSIPNMTTALSQPLYGLALSRSERILVVALSYTWCLPLFLSFGQRFWNWARHRSSNQPR